MLIYRPPEPLRVSLKLYPQTAPHADNQSFCFTISGVSSLRGNSCPFFSKGTLKAHSTTASLPYKLKFQPVMHSDIWSSAIPTQLVILGSDLQSLISSGTLHSPSATTSHPILSCSLNLPPLPTSGPLKLPIQVLQSKEGLLASECNRVSSGSHHHYRATHMGCIIRLIPNLTSSLSGTPTQVGLLMNGLLVSISSRTLQAPRTTSDPPMQ